MKLNMKSILIVFIIFLTAFSCSRSSKEKPADTGRPDTLLSGDTSFNNHLIEGNTAVLHNATYNGYIVSVSNENGSIYLFIDTVEYYTGAKAERLIKDRAFEGVYLKNATKDTLKKELAASASVILQTFSHDSSGNFNFNEKSNSGKLYKFLISNKLPAWRTKLFSFTISKNTIISVREIYIP